MFLVTGDLTFTTGKERGIWWVKIGRHPVKLIIVKNKYNVSIILRSGSLGPKTGLKNNSG